MEDLKHFITKCRALECERMEAIELQRPRTEREDEAMGVFLFEEQEVRSKIAILVNMWRKRARMERALEERQD